ncbi:MAG TPA: hypothetical protein DCX77_01180 [Acidimicrobiaceae bacterium]|nr:hypothetical protein [Acidimicrobiaceae bacterium]HAX04262.1 hypothetical protein [Acidimicrobiaceae bacterium]
MPLDDLNQLTGRVLEDRYRLTDYLGRSRAATDYVASDLETGGQVSVKIFGASISEDIEFSRHLIADATKATLVSHPSVERVHNWGSFQESAYVVTDYYPGVTLKTFLDAGQMLSPAQTLKLGIELASGLDDLHLQGLCHGDISPNSVVLSLDGPPRLSSIYLANALAAAEAGRLELVGTGIDDRLVEFQAPEHRNGSSNPKSDVYSLAMTLRAAAGQRSAVSDSVDGFNLTELSDFGHGKDVLELALEPDPEQRCDTKSLIEGLVNAASDFAKPAPIALPESSLDRATEGNLDRRTVAPVAPGIDQIRWRPVWRLGVSAVVVLMALSAATAWAVSSVRPQGVVTHDVDEYIGRTIGEVRAIADSVSWILDEDQIRTDELPAGIVIAQRPEAGSRLSEGAMLVVEVASGPRLRMTPLVLGLSTEAATARLVAKGFEVDLVQPLYDESISTGEVMKLTIDGEIALGGSLREPGTRAVLIVSGGPVPRSVPQLTGLDLGTAEGTLDSLQLTLARPVTYETSEFVPQGAVIRQSLVAGLLVERGSAVSLTLSTGPDRREVPDMRGLNVVEAGERLIEVGLKLGDVEGEGELVQATEPPAGTMLAPNSTVILWVPSD